MPLQEREVEIPLTGGLNTKVSKETASPDQSLREVKGYRFGELGALQRVSKIATTYDIAGPVAGDFPGTTEAIRSLARRGGEVFGVSDNFGVGRIPSMPGGDVQWANGIVTAGSAPDEMLRYMPMPAEVKPRWGIAGQSRYHVGFSAAGVAVLDNNVIVCAWTETATNGATRVIMAAYDSVTHERHSLAIETATTLVAPDYQCIHVERLTGTTAIVTWVYSSGAPYTIYGSTYDADDAVRQFSTQTALTTNAKTHAHGVRPSGTAGEFMFGFTDNTSGYLNVQTRTRTAVTTTWASTTYGADDGVDFAYLGGAVASNTYALSWISGTLRLAKLSAIDSPDTKLALTIISGSSFTAATLCGTSMEGVDAPMMIAAELSHGLSVRSIVHFEAGDPATESIVTKGLQYHARLAGKAFQVGYYGHYFAQISDENALTSTVLVRAYTPDQEIAVARVFHEVSTLRDANFRSTAWSVGVNGNTVHVCAPNGLQPDASYGRHGSSVRIGSVAMLDEAAPAPFVEDRGSTVVAGGLPWTYDGRAAFPSAPLRAPHEPNVTLVSGSTTATFAVCAVYRWIDASGKLYRSAPSAAVTTSPSSQQVNVSIDLPPFEAHKYIDETSLEIELYATEDGGSNFYLTTYTSFTVGNGEVTFQEVVPGSDSATQLYTDGGELAADAPPSLVNIVRVQDRLVGLDAEDRTLVRFTKPIVEGFAPEWSSLNTVMIGDEGVAVFEHAGEIGVLCKNGVWKVSGAGPNANGLGTFAPPYRVPVELQGVSAQSVVQTPLGTMFLALHGVMLMGLGGDLQLIGLPVQGELNGNHVTVRRASYWPRANEVRFLVDDIGDSEARVFSFNVVEGKWSRDDVQERDDAAAAVSGAVYDEVVVGDWLYACNGDNNVVRYAPDDLDGLQSATAHNSITGDFVLDTHYFKPDGLTGQGRVWRVDVAFRCDDTASTTVLDLDLYKLDDGEAGSVVSSHDFSSGELSWAAGEMHWVSLYPSEQRMAGLRLRVQVSDTTARRGVVPVAMRIKYGVEPNAARMESQAKGPTVVS